MPTLGADMEAGTLVEWVKRPGETLARGDIIAVVDTEKGAIEIEVFHEGVLDRTVIQPGEKVPVGTVLAFIRDMSESPGAEASPAVSQEAVEGAVPQAPEPARAAQAPSGTTTAALPRQRRISPAARKAADELNVDVSRVEGTGPGGSVTRADVERAAHAAKTPPDARSAAPPPPSAPSDRIASMRTAIAAAMSRSKREIPHLYLATTVEMSRLLQWVTVQNAQRSVTERLLPLAVQLKAVARAVVDVPEINGFWVDAAFRPGPGVHIGCAVALRDGGLVAPALHDVDGKDIDTVMRDLRGLITRARAGTLRSSELADSTITVTSLGDLGVESVFGIIYPPQVALVGFGRIVDRPWAIDGRVEARSVMTASVSADHRAVDGRRAGLFLGAIERWMQQPESL
jgi:pyruvate dehydrogenase E2 component (dihydrolipoamide acetyltransferase)